MLRTLPPATALFSGEFHSHGAPFQERSPVAGNQPPYLRWASDQEPSRSRTPAPLPAYPWNEGPALICLVGPALLCRRQRCFAVVNLQRGWDEGRPHCAALEGLWTRRGGSADHICVFVTGLLAPQRHGRDSWLTTLCRRVRAAAVCVWCRLLTEGRNT